MTLYNKLFSYLNFKIQFMILVVIGHHQIKALTTNHVNMEFAYLSKGIPYSDKKSKGIPCSGIEITLIDYLSS